MTNTLLEELFSASGRLTEKAFATQFPGPFLVQTRVPQKAGEFDVPFDTALGSLQNKSTKDITVRPLSAGDSQRFIAIGALNSIQDLLRYHALFEVKKSQRNTFQQGIAIGRTNNNDVVIVETTISKFHAWIQPPGPARKHFTIFDANSHYGTLVDYAKVEAEGAALQPGAKIRLGNATMAFLFGDGLYKWALEKRSLFK